MMKDDVYHSLSTFSLLFCIAQTHLYIFTYVYSVHHHMNPGMPTKIPRDDAPDPITPVLL